MDKKEKWLNEILQTDTPQRERWMSDGTWNYVKKQYMLKKKTKHMPFFVRNAIENFTDEPVLSILCVLSPIVIGVLSFIFRNLFVMPVQINVFYFAMALVTGIFSVCSESVIEHCSLPVSISILYVITSTFGIMIVSLV